MSGRKKPDQPTLEQQYDDLLSQATQASLQDRDADAMRHFEAALAVVRELYATSANRARHRPVLAGALYNHAGLLRRAGRPDEAVALLTESGQHYEVLAAADPASYQVRRIDVLVRIGLASETAGDLAGAEARLREAIRMYRDAPARDVLERDLGLARAHFHLGRCLLERDRPAEGLTEVDTGLFAAEGAREQHGISAADFSWLATAPPSFQFVALDWLGGAVCAMELHDAAGRFDIAADAANIAVRVSAGLAAMGGAGMLRVYQAVLRRAEVIWQHAQHPFAAASERARPTQEVIVSGSRVLFATPDLQEIFQAAGWDFTVQPDG